MICSLKHPQFRAAGLAVQVTVSEYTMYKSTVSWKTSVTPEPERSETSEEEIRWLDSNIFSVKLRELSILAPFGLIRLELTVNILLCSQQLVVSNLTTIK